MNEIINTNKVTLISLEGGLSLSLPVLQQILLDEGYDCHYIHIPLKTDVSDYELNSITEQLKKICKDSIFIGFSCMTNTYLQFFRLAKIIKEMNIPIVAGGVHPTVKPEECLKIANYVCVGDGEEAIVELADFLSNKKNKIAKIKSIYQNYNGKIIKNKLRDINVNLDDFPIPCFDFNRWFVYHEKMIKPMNKHLIKQYYSPYYYIMTSRGCPYKCSYCLNDCLIKINKGFLKIRRRSTTQIIEELKLVKNLLGNDIIIGFVDDDFCAKSSEEIKNFCELFKKEIGLKFFCASTPTSMNRDKIESLIDAGLIRLEIGIQTINDKINKEVYNRFALKKNVVDVVKLLEDYRYKLNLCYDIILDNPWESEETVLETLNFILNMKKPINILIFSLTLYPGTSLYERAKKEGIIKNDILDVYTKNHMILLNNNLSTLFVLYTKYNFPKIIIEGLIRIRNQILIKSILNKTTFLWKLYLYISGLKRSFRKNDKEKRDYYLLAPMKLILRKVNRGIM